MRALVITEHGPPEVLRVEERPIRGPAAGRSGSPSALRASTSPTCWRAWAEAGRIRPVVAEALPLERGAEARRYAGEGRHVGKVVLTV